MYNFPSNNGCREKKLSEKNIKEDEKFSGG
jgi:hypothetical protein